MLVWGFEESPQKIRVPGGHLPPPPPSARVRRLVLARRIVATLSSTAFEGLRGLSDSCWRESGVAGGSPPWTRIFWGDSSKRRTRISWRARVAPGNATRRGPRRGAPLPHPAAYMANTLSEAPGGIQTEHPDRGTLS